MSAHRRDTAPSSVPGERWNVQADDALIADPGTAPIMECIGLVMGELLDEDRAVAGYNALRALHSTREALNQCRADLARASEARENYAGRAVRAELAIARSTGEARTEPPVLHERHEGGGWWCCCGDHLEPDAASGAEDGEPVAWEVLRNGKRSEITTTPERANFFREFPDWTVRELVYRAPYTRSSNPGGHRNPGLANTEGAGAASAGAPSTGTAEPGDTDAVGVDVARLHDSALATRGVALRRRATGRAEPGDAVGEDGECAECERLHAANERLRRDRYALLNLKTTEGMSAAEWQMRTATAVARAEAAEAALADATNPPRHRDADGGYITTFTGKQWRHTAPSADMVDIEDIAHALANLCHWGGHSARFFSVAQHSVLVSHLCPPEIALWGLLHDVAEAYYGDMTRPLKVLLPEYRAHEQRGMRVIAEALGLPWPEPPELKRFDNLALAVEAKALMPLGALHDGHGNGLDLGEIPSVDIEPMNPADAKVAFLRRYAELTGDPDYAHLLKPTPDSTVPGQVEPRGEADATRVDVARLHDSALATRGVALRRRATGRAEPGDAVGEDGECAECERLHAANERLRRDRYALLNLKTTEGMSAAEWQMRTATAVARAEAAEAAFARTTNPPRHRDADGWRPIESAPKDGTDILLSDGKVVTLGGWLMAEDMELPEDFDWSERWWSVAGDEPTHWMPLPPTPDSTVPERAEPRGEAHPLPGPASWADLPRARPRIDMDHDEVEPRGEASGE